MYYVKEAPVVNNKICSDDIINGIGAGISILDRDFRIVWLNKTQSDWFGFPQDVCGRHCYEVYEKRNHICRGCPTRKVFDSGKVHEALRMASPIGSLKRHYHLTVSPIKDKDEHVMYAVELIQDITDKVVQEKYRRKVTSKLKRMFMHLAAVNKRLRNHAHKLSDVTERMGEFKSVLQKKYRRKISELANMKEELQNIFKVNRAVSSSVDSKKISALVTKLTCELMHTDACILRLLDEQNKTLAIDSSYGLSSSLVKKIFVVKLGESICGQVGQTKKAMAVYDLDKEPRLKNPEVLAEEGFRSLACAPVLFQNKTLGVLTTFSRRPRVFSGEDLEVLNIFAAQAAVAVHESKHYESIYMNYFNTIHALVLAMEARDPYTRGHTERVTKFALQIARLLKMPKPEQEILRYAGEVHDVGKIGIPDFVLNKPGKLTPAERAIIELHPIKGAEMLEPLDFLKPAIPVVRHHHERYDGTGYPDGLEKQNIPLLSRILACADAFDAMTSERPYRRRKLNMEEALVEIKNNSGSQFDPYIADVFVKALHIQPPVKALC